MFPCHYIAECSQDVTLGVFLHVAVAVVVVAVVVVVVVVVVLVSVVVVVVLIAHDLPIHFHRRAESHA